MIGGKDFFFISFRILSIRDMKSDLLYIKTFLSTYARLDLNSEIEYHLMRLALVSEVTPRANMKYCTVTPLPACLHPS